MSHQCQRLRAVSGLRFVGRLLSCAVLALAAGTARADLLIVRDVDVSASQDFVDELSARLAGQRTQRSVSVAAQDYAAGRQRLLGAAPTDNDDDVAFDFPPRTRSLGAASAPVSPAGEERKALQATTAERPVTVAVGPAALRAVMQTAPRDPVVAVLVSRGDVEQAGPPPGSALYAIVTNQPARRQLALIGLALPERKRIGVVYPPDAEDLVAELRSEARRQGASLVARRSDTASDLSSTLAEVLPASDLMLLLADPVSLAPGVAQSVLRAAASARKPVVASTEALVRAGALLGVFTTRAQFVEEAADCIASLQRGERPPAFSTPRRFSVGVNPSVAHALALAVPDEAQLQQRLTATP